MHSKILSQYQEYILKNKYSDLKIFESTRGVFTEGGPAFEGATCRSRLWSRSGWLPDNQKGITKCWYRTRLQRGCLSIAAEIKITSLF